MQSFMKGGSFSALRGMKPVPVKTKEKQAEAAVREDDTANDDEPVTTAVAVLTAKQGKGSSTPDGAKAKVGNKAAVAAAVGKQGATKPAKKPAHKLGAYNDHTQPNTEVTAPAQADEPDLHEVFPELQSQLRSPSVLPQHVPANQPAEPQEAFRNKAELLKEIKAINKAAEVLDSLVQPEEKSKGKRMSLIEACEKAWGRGKTWGDHAERLIPSQIAEEEEDTYDGPLVFQAPNDADAPEAGDHPQQEDPVPEPKPCSKSTRKRPTARGKRAQETEPAEPPNDANAPPADSNITHITLESPEKETLAVGAEPNTSTGPAVNARTAAKGGKKHAGFAAAKPPPARALNQTKAATRKAPQPKAPRTTAAGRGGNPATQATPALTTASARLAVAALTATAATADATAPSPANTGTLKRVREQVAGGDGLMEEGFAKSARAGGYASAAEVRRLQQLLEVSQRECEGMKEKHAALEAELKGAQERERGLQRELGESSRREKEQAVQVERLQKQLDLAHLDATKNKEQADKAASKKEVQLQKEVERLKKDLAKAEKEAEQHKETANTLRVELKASEARNQKQQKQQAGMLSAAAEYEAALRSQLERLGQEAGRLMAGFNSAQLAD